MAGMEGITGPAPERTLLSCCGAPPEEPELPPPSELKEEKALVSWLGEIA